MPIVIEQMTTAYVPIGNDTNDVIVEADSFEREFAYEDEDGLAVDFTGYTGTCQIRDTDGTLIASPTVAALDSTGIVKLTLATLPAVGIYDYDVEINAGAVKKTIQRGPFQTTKQQTQ